MKKILIMLSACLITGSVWAMDWPVQDGQVLQNFGYNDQGQPSLGVCFASQGPVRAADAGELIFYNDSESNDLPLPSPMGSWAAVDQGDGMVSIYSHLNDAGGLQIPTLVEKDSIIAASGKSGWAAKTGFCFALFDRKERRWVNPAMIISSAADTVPPEIGAVTLEDAKGRLIDIANVRNIVQGRYTVLVKTFDKLSRAANAQALAPQRIVCLLNGAQLGVLNFETYSVRDGVLMAYRNSLVPARQVYRPWPAYEVADISFSRGQAALEIIVQDASGNSATRNYRLQVN